jgi:cellobiose epimerase
MPGVDAPAGHRQRPTMPTTMTGQALRAAIAQELHGNLLPFWRTRSVDPAGGFIAEMSADGVVTPDAPRGLILAARLLWTFSTLYRRLGDARDLELTRHAAEALDGGFRDRAHGGYHWRLDAAGEPLESVKRIYGQAFCVYALSEQHRATGDAAPLAAAREVYDLIERHASDRDHGGYIEARAADWSATDDLRLSPVDLDAAKSMNTHLHLLEAYANLYRAWPDPRLAARLRELIVLFQEHIVERDAGGEAVHLRPFFDAAWSPQADTYTYGHDIEAAWLLAEAASVLDNEGPGGDRLAAGVGATCVAIARAVLRQGLAADGGLHYEGHAGAVIDDRRDWWCQAEAVVGFWHAYQVTGEMAFARAAEHVWAYIRAHVVDPLHGEWHWRVLADGSVDTAQPKVSEWKGPYHAVRMCLEMLDRVDGDEEEPSR